MHRPPDLGMFFEHDDVVPERRQFGSRRQTGRSCADNDDIPNV